MSLDWISWIGWTWMSLQGSTQAKLDGEIWASAFAGAAIMMVCVEAWWSGDKEWHENK